MIGHTADFEGVAKEAKELFLQNQEKDWAKVAVNALLVPLTFGCMGIPVEDNSKSTQQPMPDEWLQVVSQLPIISKDGLALLANALTKNGFISVHDAVTFVEIEQKLMKEQSKALEKTRKQDSQFDGAVMLLARAESELPGSIERFIQGTKDVVKVTSIAAGFAKSKAEQLSKGLTATTGLMKELRERWGND